MAQKMLVFINADDCAFQIEAVGDDVAPAVEAIYKQWETDDPDYVRQDFPVIKFGETVHHWDKEGPCYAIFEA